MNHYQKLVILIALALLLLVGVFLPYNGEQSYFNEKSKIFLGYYTAFDPPTRRDMAKSFLKSEYKPVSFEITVDDFLKENFGKARIYEASISILILITEIFILLILTIGLLVFYSHSKHKEKPAINKEG